MTRAEMRHAIFNRCELTDAEFRTEYGMPRPVMEMVYRAGYDGAAYPSVTDAYVASLTRAEMLTALFDATDLDCDSADAEARFQALDGMDRAGVEGEYRKHCLTPLEASDFTTEEIDEMYDRYTQR